MNQTLLPYQFAVRQHAVFSADGLEGEEIPVAREMTFVVRAPSRDAAQHAAEEFAGTVPGARTPPELEFHGIGELQ